jgi:type I restriction enzyme S subunit
VTLGDVADHVTDGIDPAGAGRLPYVGLEHIRPREMLLARSGDAAEIRSRKTVFQSGDLLYGKLRPYLDKAVLAEAGGMCSTDILVLRTKSANTLEDQPGQPAADPYFLAGVLHTRDFVSHAIATTAGVNHPRTSWSAVKQFQLALPPLPEQRAIAQVLRTVQRAREQTEQVIAAAQAFKRSLMGHLFTYGLVAVNEVSRVDLQRADQGDVPSHWEIRPLGEVATLQRGKDLPKADRTGGLHPVVGSNGRVGAHSEAVASGPGVLVGRSGSVGNVVWEEEDFWPLNTTLWVKNFHENDPRFVFYLLSRFDFRAYASGVSVPTLNRNLIHPVRVGVPQVSEQREIAAALDAAESKLAAETHRRDALDTLFKSLLHYLMAARLRVGDFALGLAS